MDKVLPDATEMKLAILRALKDKYLGEYKNNLIPPASLGWKGAVENYLGVSFDDDMRYFARKCFDELRDADLIRSTHSTNRDPDNWVKITKTGLNALESGNVVRQTDNPERRSQINRKFGIAMETSFDLQLKSVIDQSGPVSVIFLDFDNFKSVNDNHDHEVGDQVIREAFQLIQIAIRSKGELFHRSGDEMLILLPNFDDHEATSVGERIRKSIKEYDFSTVGKGVITATIGVATYPTACAKWEDLKVTADRTAMRAKKQGKDLVAHSSSVGDPALKTESADYTTNQQIIHDGSRVLVLKK